MLPCEVSLGGGHQWGQVFVDGIDGEARPHSEMVVADGTEPGANDWTAKALVVVHDEFFGGGEFVDVQCGWLVQRDVAEFGGRVAVAADDWGRTDLDIGGTMDGDISVVEHCRVACIADFPNGDERLGKLWHEVGCAMVWRQR